MKAKELMTTAVVTVRPDDSVKEAAQRLVRQRITAAPVVDSGGRVVGIVSEADLVGREVLPDPRAQIRPVGDVAPPHVVRDVMSRNVIAVAPDCDGALVARVLVQSRVKSVPVLDGEQLVGIVSQRDLLRILARSDEEIREDVVRRLDEYTGGAVRWSVTVQDGAVELAGEAGDDYRIPVLLARTVPGVTEVRVVTRQPAAATS
jgi:CBS domain-containing protein